jgi:hypothetical protein
MQSQFGGSVSVGPACLNLGTGRSATDEASQPAAFTAPTAVVGLLAPVDPNGRLPHWVLALRQGAEQSDATEIEQSRSYEDARVLKSAGVDELASPRKTEVAITELGSTGAGLTLPPQRFPRWSKSLSR